MNILFKHCLILLFFCSISSCLIFEDEPLDEVSDHCSNGVYDAGIEEGIDCGVICQVDCPDPTCDDGIQNGNENGIDCGWACDALCYIPPTCNTLTNTIECDDGTYIFEGGGSGSIGSTSYDFIAVGDRPSSNMRMWIYIDGLRDYTKSQTVFYDYYADEVGEIELDFRFGTTTSSSISPIFSTDGSIPFEYHPETHSFTLYFCGNSVGTYTNTVWDPNYFDGSVTFKIN